MSRSASPVKRVKRGLERKKSESESNRVSKSVSEFTLRCCSELEEQLMHVTAKKERLLGRLDECERQLREKDVRMSETFASVADKTSGVRVSAAKQGVSVREPVKKRSYAVVVKPKDESVKLTSEQVECVMKNVSGELTCESE